jgi:hypothetical protein
MRATHQQKEIVWIREKLKLEDQLKQAKQLISTPISSIERTIPVVVQMSKPSVICYSPNKLEKQTEEINNSNNVQQQELVRVDYKQVFFNIFEKKIKNK